MAGPNDVLRVVNGLGRAVHLFSAGELFRQGYPNSAVAVCGEPVISGADSGEDRGYCPDCVSAALQWCAQPGTGELADISGRADDC